MVKLCGRPALTSVVLLFALMVFARTSSAQSTAEDRNAVYLELGGNGGVFSINYEREISDRIRARVGFGWWTSESFFSDAETSLTTVRSPSQGSSAAGRIVSSSVEA